MTYTDQLIEASRERARIRANVLQSGLGQRLYELNQPQYKRLKLGLDKLKTQHINLLDEAVVNRKIKPGRKIQALFLSSSRHQSQGQTALTYNSAGYGNFVRPGPLRFRRLRSSSN